MQAHEDVVLEVVSEPPAPNQSVLHSPLGASTDAPMDAVTKQALWASVVATAGTLAACGGGGGATSPSPSPPPPPPPPPAPPTSNQAARFLQQAQFSSLPTEIAAVQSQGYATWLDSQLAATQGQGGWDWLVSQGYQTAAFRFFSAPTDYMVWYQLINRTDAVRVRMALALSEIFVVSVNSMDIPYRSMAMGAYWDVLCTNAFGNFRTLLDAITFNPAMGNYLNLKGSRKADATGRMPDENYAREVMQLFTIGLYELNTDGSQKTSGGAPIETYGQQTISDLAKVFTGWDYDGTGSSADNPTQVKNPLINSLTYHDTSGITLFGTAITAGTDAAGRMKQALDIIFAHANVAPFVCKQLIQRLVTSNPSAAYVSRVATVFNNNGAGVRGDLRAVFKAIVLDDEARSDTSAAQPTWGKLREPMLRFVHWARTFKAKLTTGTWKMPDTSDAAKGLGQSPLRSPSVFNFYRPGYIPPNTALATAQLVAPEFQITDESTVASYINYMQSVIKSGVASITSTYDDYLPIVGDVTALMDQLNLVLCAGAIPATSLKTIRDALSTISTTTTTGQQNRLYAAILLTMASPQYLVQK